jgi:uncharacterized membrane protein
MDNHINLKRYALTYFAVSVAIAIALVLLENLLGWSISRAGGSMVPTLVAAMIEGQKRAEAGADPLSAGQAWRQAGRLTLVAFLVQLAFMFLALMAAGFYVAVLVGVGIAELWSEVPDMLETAAQGSAIFFAIGAFYMAMIFVVNRIFLAIGYRNQRKVMLRKAAL